MSKIDEPIHQDTTPPYIPIECPVAPYGQDNPLLAPFADGLMLRRLSHLPLVFDNGRYQGQIRESLDLISSQIFDSPYTPIDCIYTMFP